jgi:hypothetical protein
VLSACGGSSERVLHLSGGNFTESQFRANVRTTLASNAGGNLCAAIKGLAPQDAASVIIRAQSSSITPTVQAGNEADRSRAAQIVQEECANIGK